MGRTTWTGGLLVARWAITLIISARLAVVTAWVSSLTMLAGMFLLRAVNARLPVTKVQCGEMGMGLCRLSGLPCRQGAHRGTNLQWHSDWANPRADVARLRHRSVAFLRFETSSL